MLQRRRRFLCRAALILQRRVRHNWDVNGLRLRSEEVSNIASDFSILELDKFSTDESMGIRIVALRQ